MRWMREEPKCERCFFGSHLSVLAVWWFLKLYCSGVFLIFSLSPSPSLPLSLLFVDQIQAFSYCSSTMLSAMLNMDSPSDT